MSKSTSILMLAALATSSAAIVAAAPAQAREHGRLVHARGPYGGGYIAGRHVQRRPGSTEVTRGMITRGGRGYRQTRSTSYGDGAIRNDVQRRYANGASMSRSGTTVRNPDGSISTSRTRTGSAGNTQTGWSKIYRTDDGYTRTRGGSTSSGRAYSATRDVSVAADSVTINRNAVTASGRSVTQTRTFPRPD